MKFNKACKTRNETRARMESNDVFYWAKRTKQTGRDETSKQRLLAYKQSALPSELEAPLFSPDKTSFQKEKKKNTPPKCIDVSSSAYNMLIFFSNK